jgi:hypothetical protein
MTFSDKTLQAARAVLSSRNPSRADLRRTTTPQRNPLSVRDAASAYKVRKSAVQRAVGFLKNPLPRGRGRPMALTDDEDDALVAYVQWMERTGMPATREQLEGAANTIRLRRNPNASGASPNWLTVLAGEGAIQRSRKHTSRPWNDHGKPSRSRDLKTPSYSILNCRQLS